MIDAIQSFLQNILDFFLQVWGFIVSFFEDIAFLIETVFGFFQQIPSYLSFIPSPVIAILFVGFTGAVIYKILGRE